MVLLESVEQARIAEKRRVWEQVLGEIHASPGLTKALNTDVIRQWVDDQAERLSITSSYYYQQAAHTEGREAHANKNDPPAGH
jgi:hypothetical protein